MAFSKIFSKAFQTKRLKKRDYDPEAISIEDIKLPTIYKEYDSTRINIEIKSELKAYKSLGYRTKKNLDDLENKAYHAFQIGMLIKAIKLDLEANIDVLDDYFHKDVLKLDQKTVVSMTSDVFKKFNKNTSSQKSEIMLKKDLLFTPNDLGYLLYYLTFYKKL